MMMKDRNQTTPPRTLSVQSSQASAAGTMGEEDAAPAYGPWMTTSLELLTSVMLGLGNLVLMGAFVVLVGVFGVVYWCGCKLTGGHIHALPPVTNRRSARAVSPGRRTAMSSSVEKLSRLCS